MRKTAPMVMSILIVDDNEIFLILLDKMLQAHHHTVLWASSGVEAMKVLENQPDVQLVIADIVMPEMSGLELLRQMKKSVLFKDIPVILCSVMADIENVRQGAILGCHSYLVKPVQRDHLLQKVSQVLAATKPVLSPLRAIQTKYGLERKTCLELIRAFLKLLKSQIDALEAHRQNPVNLLPPLLLKQLGEGAAILGAEQLEIRINEVSQALETKVNLDSQLLRFMRDMRQLYSALENQIATAPDREGSPAADSFNRGGTSSSGSSGWRFPRV